MVTQFCLADIVVSVQRKDIKSLRLRVCLPNGEVRISAPRQMALDTIHGFALSKLDWIRKCQQKIIAQPREAPRQYRDGESHYVWGLHYVLRVEEKRTVPSVTVADAEMILQVRPGADIAKRAAVLKAWYRQELGQALHPLVRQWEERIGVQASAVRIQRMKTKWGSCNTRTGSIRFNLELAKKHPACLEYVVVHELVHLIEPSHNARFKVLMSRYLPQWKDLRQELNRTTMEHERLDG